MSENSPVELLRMRDLVLQMRQDVTDDIVELLEGTTWGTPGGTQYKHLHAAEKIREVKEPYILELRKAEKLQGLVCLAHRVSLYPEPDGHNTFYIRYLSMMEGKQRKVNTETATPTTGSKSNSLVKRALARLLDDPKALLEATGRDHAVYYAYVELENERSMEMTRTMGFKPIGKFSTLVFSRLRPKSDNRARRVTAEDRPKVEARLKEEFKNHALFTLQNLFYKDNYWILEENGELIAGLQANRAHWVLENMPGFSGKLIMNVLPYVPLIRRMYNPKKYEFVVVEGIFCKEGREKDLYRLLEHTCVENKVHSALIWLDRIDPMFERLKKYGKLGILQRINGDSQADIIAKYVNVPEEDQEWIQNRPRYISAFDST
jgi:hypothetical protein